MDPSQSAKNDAKPASTHDRIIRATAFGHAIRAFACWTTGLCQEAVRLHGLSPVAAAA